MTGIVFSVVIPTHERPSKLESCLAALCDQTYPPEHFEVIVVDDGGTVALESIVLPFRNRFSVRLLRQPNTGPASARNRGAAVASGTYVAFTDDDCRPDMEWLEAFDRRFAEAPMSLLGGRTVNALPDNDYSEASQHLIAYLYAYYGAGTGRPAFFASNNMAVPLDLFHDVGGFDAAFPLAAGEDRDFCDRWHAHGFPAAYVHESRVYHVHEMDFVAFARQHFTYGRGAFHFHRSRRERTNRSFFVEPLSFYTGLIRHPLAHRKTARAWFQSGLLAFGQMANAGGFFWERLRTGVSRT